MSFEHPTVPPEREPLTLPEIMAASLEIRQYLPERLVDKFDRISENAMRQAAARSVWPPERSNVIPLDPHSRRVS